MTPLVIANEINKGSYYGLYTQGLSEEAVAV
jgi:hypothetical protein